MQKWTPELAERQRQRRAKAKRAAKRSQRPLAQEIIALAGRGTSRADIARSLELNPRTIRRVLKLDQAGIEATARRRKRVDHTQIRKLYSTGITKAEIVRRLHTSWTTVRRALDGLPATPVDDQNVRRRRALEVLNLVDQGVGKTEIARRLQVGRDSIYKLVAVRKAGGIPTMRRWPKKPRQARRRARRIALIGELTQSRRPPGRTELARRLAVAPSTIYGDRISVALLPQDELPPYQIAARHRAAARDDRRAQVRELVAQGLNESAIALRLGVDRRTICNDLSHRPKRSWRRSELQERDRQARDLYAQGMTKREIGRRLCISRTTIYRDLQMAVRPYAGQRLAAQVRGRVARGAGKQTIARRLHVAPEAVYAVPKAVQPRLSEKIAARAQALFAQGLSRRAIARELRVSRDTVERALASGKTVPFFRQKTPLHPNRRRALRVLDLIGQGLSKMEVSRRLKVDRSTIKRVIETEASGGVATIRRHGKVNPVAARRLFNQGV